MRKIFSSNCAPMALSWQITALFSPTLNHESLTCHVTRSRQIIKITSRCFLTAAKFASAEVPITNAKWYGGQADVPKSIILARTKASIDFSFNNDLVCWYK
jgi:hypothetical protein